MRTLELLLNRRWILKSRERELYYQVKEELSSGEEKKFLMEKLGYQVVVNPYMIKVEKMPAVPENWMGILEFKEPIEYVFFCLVLMFLEDKEAEEQFVLSELTEYVQSQYQEEQIDWTVYRYRRHMIKVMKYCVAVGILNVDDGSEEGFAKDDTSEVLYENTGASRYFMKNFTQDIMGYTSAKEFEKEEWIDVNEDRGIVRRQRVYRKLLMSMGMYKDAKSSSDSASLPLLFHKRLSAVRQNPVQIRHLPARLSRPPVELLRKVLPVLLSHKCNASGDRQRIPAPSLYINNEK